MKAVILAGGSGTRFWPASRRSRPKQFLNILGQRTMLQETMARLEPLLSPSDLFVVCSPQYLEDVRSQAPGLERDQIIIEPAPRSTAACIGLAALQLRKTDPDAVMVVLPADHQIQNTEELHSVLEAAAQLARKDWLVTFGIRPTFPSTGYGYLERGGSLGRFKGKEAYRVIRFVEKPDLSEAGDMLLSQRFDWNSGIFVWKLDTILHQLQLHMPRLYRTLAKCDLYRDDAAKSLRLFESLDQVSIDRGVMEKAEKVASIPCDLGWSDVGNWHALSELLPADSRGNVSNVHCLALDSSNCLVHASPDKLVALLGVEDLVVVETPDAVLVCDRNRAEEVKRVVAELKAKGLEEFL